MNEELHKQLHEKLNNKFNEIINNKLSILKNGIWNNNPALVQILGLCPLLAVSNNVINSLGLGIATLFVLLLSNLIVAATRNYLRHEIRIPIFVLIIASSVSVAELLIQAFAYQLYQSLGIFLSLIVTNCLLIARAESFSSKNGLLDSFLDALGMGLGFMWVLLLIGTLREIISMGTIFSGAENIFGASGKKLTIHLWQGENGAILAALPSGAFIIYGLIIAAKNYINNVIANRRKN